MARNRLMKIVDRKFTPVNLGLLRVFLSDNLLSAAITQIDSDIERLKLNIKALEELRQEINKETGHGENTPEKQEGKENIH